MKIPDYSKKRIKKLKEIYNDYVREEDKELIRLTKEVDRLNNIIKEAINYIDDNTYYKDHKGHINIDDLYIILKGSDKE